MMRATCPDQLDDMLADHLARIFGEGVVGGEQLGSFSSLRRLNAMRASNQRRRRAGAGPRSSAIACSGRRPDAASGASPHRAALLARIVPVDRAVLTSRHAPTSTPSSSAARSGEGLLGGVEDAAG